MLSFPDPFITVSPEALGTSANKVSKALELDGSAKRGKEGDYTASAAVGRPNGQDKMLKVIDYLSYKTNKATTFPPVIKQKKHRHKIRNKGIFPKYYGKVPFPNQELLSRDMEMSL